MRLAACVVAVSLTISLAETLSVNKRVVSPGEVRGAAMARDGRLFTWGDALAVRDASLEKSRVLSRQTFGEGGCLVDLDNDGQEEFVGKEGLGLGRLTWRKPPEWKPVVLEKQTDTHDCLQATLFGRKGVLTIHRFMQVRFYEYAPAGKPWIVHEIYSIYTPSKQTGLSLHDVNGDGRLDIVCGNYWIQSPERFDLPWHIYAINTWFEKPESAMQAHALVDGNLFVAQSHAAPARVALFRKPEDVRQLWQESPVPGAFQRVHAVAIADGRIVFAEHNGPASRVFELRGGAAVPLADGVDTLKLFPIRDGLVSVGPHVILRWDYRRR
jgi:hypothetical protein